jgi:hypothetical protein
VQWMIHACKFWRKKHGMQNTSGEELTLPIASHFLLSVSSCLTNCWCYYYIDLFTRINLKGTRSTFIFLGEYVFRSYHRLETWNTIKGRWEWEQSS